MTRLDKLVSDKLNITPSQAKALIKAGSVSVNGTAVLSCDFKCGDSDSVFANGSPLDTREYVYIMMNKPQGTVCSTDDKDCKTVIDLLPDDMRRKGLFPAGRLDKDTTGFVLITDDGELAHRILSPKSHIVKTYIVTLDKPVTDEIISDFEQGMTLGEERLLPAKLTVMNGSTARVEISQGIYHQIKRMFKKHGLTVTALRRIKMGGVTIDENLSEGKCRYLTESEVGELRK